MTDFAEFWQLFPKKIAKRDAEKAWAKLTPDEQRQAIEALPKHTRYWDATTTKQYIPYPATWLNAARWEDELEMPEVKAVAWWATERGVMDMGKKLQVLPRAGEDLQTYKQRVVDAFKKAA